MAARSLPSRVCTPRLAQRQAAKATGVTHLQDRLSGLLEDVFIELRVVHGQTTTREQVQDSLVLLVTDHFPHVSQGSRVSHVNRDGVSVTERSLGHKLVQWRPAISNVSIRVCRARSKTTYVWP